MWINPKCGNCVIIRTFTDIDRPKCIQTLKSEHPFSIDIIHWQPDDLLMIRR